MLNKTLKKALITCNVNLTDHDGKSLRLLNLAKIVHDIGFEVTIIVNNCYLKEISDFSVIQNKSPLRNTVLDDLLMKTFHYFKQFIKLFSFYLKLLITKIDFDLVISSFGPETDSILACILSKIKRVPFIYDYDDPSPELRIAYYGKNSYNPTFRLSKIIKNFLIRNACLVITAADTVKYQIMRDFRWKKRVCVWYNLPKINDLNICQDKEILRRKLGFESDSFIFSYIGKVPNWGIETIKEMLIAFAENFRRDEKIYFLIVGGGWWEEYYRTVIKNLGLEKQVLITGFLPRQEAIEYLIASDVSCIPYGFNVASQNIVPTKLFESMAFGVPIICIKSSNYVKILGENAIYFDGSCKDFFAKIRWCIANKGELIKISRNLKLRFQCEYRWEKRLITLGNVIKSLIYPH